MPRSQRLKIVLEGDLAKALAWDAERRGINVQDLAKDLLGSSGFGILERWRDFMLDMERFGARPDPKESRSIRSVLAKAYGPPRRRRRLARNST